MPDFQFPDPSVETTAYNAETGTTYQWKENPGKWVSIKAEQEDNSEIITELTEKVSENTADISENSSDNSRQDTALENLAIESSGHESRITKLELKPDIGPELEQRIEAGESIQKEIATRIETALVAQGEIENELDELQVQRGAGMHYTCIALTMPQTVRAGQVGFSNAAAENVQYLGLGDEDEHGTLTKTILVDDIIEVIKSDGTGPRAISTRFKAVSIENAPNNVHVEYISGAQVFDIGTSYIIYIYPQNTATAAKNYVDQQDDKQVSKSGDIMTDELRSKTGKHPLTAFAIQDVDSDNFSWKIWSPAGSGSETKYVGNYNTDHWFQVYNENDQNPITTAKFAYQNFHLQAEPGVGYGGTDKHYFTGDAVFFNRVTYDGPTENDYDIVSKQYLDKTIVNANSVYLKDGQTTNKLCINRTAGGDIDSMKVSNITGGSPVWRLDCKAGSDGPVIYKTEGWGTHNFVGKVDIERVGQERQGFCIKGRNTDGEEGELFYVYHNAGDVADAVNYTGKINTGMNIVNKKYVDEAIAAATSATEFNALKDEVDQNEEQLQALSTNFMQTVFNVQNLLSEIQELKTRISNLENG